MDDHKDKDKDNYDLHTMFYNDLAIFFLKNMRDNYKAEFCEVILYNRSHGKFYCFNNTGLAPLPPEEEALIIAAQKTYNNQDSDFYDDKENGFTGLSLISTQLGALGFIVIQNINWNQEQKNYYGTNHDVITLNKFGVLYGNLVMNNFRNIVEDSFSFNDTELLAEFYNPYIPIGDSKCTVMFLDIRGLYDIIEKKVSHVQFIRKFSQKVQEITQNHFGIVRGHFGGSMLIMFNQIKHDRHLAFSCCRAICAMKKVQNVFKQLAPDFKESIDLGIGASTGPAWFSTFGSGLYFFFTAISKEIGTAKKIENLSGRRETKDKIFVSDGVIKQFEFLGEGIAKKIENLSDRKETKDEIFVLDDVKQIKSLEDKCFITYSDAPKKAKLPYSKREIYSIENIYMERCPLHSIGDECPDCKSSRNEEKT